MENFITALACCGPFTKGIAFSIISTMRGARQTPHPDGLEKLNATMLQEELNKIIKTASPALQQMVPDGSESAFCATFIYYGIEFQGPHGEKRPPNEVFDLVALTCLMDESGLLFDALMEALEDPFHKSELNRSLRLLRVEAGLERSDALVARANMIEQTIDRVILEMMEADLEEDEEPPTIYTLH